MASLLAVALVGRLAIGMSRGETPPTEFLSSFTVLSNVLAMAMLAMYAVRPGLGGSKRFSFFRGAVTVSMAMTVTLFASLQTSLGTVPGSTEPWVDWSLGFVGPVAVLADWLAFPPPLPFAVRDAAAWTALPVLYLGYTLTRGAMTDYHAYPFLDPNEVGGRGVAIWSGTALAVTLAIALLSSWWATRRSQKPRKT